MLTTNHTLQAPIITSARHRLQIDGQGVTTLVLFHGCPLRCKWCINPFSFSPETKVVLMTPEALYEKVKIDDLYFRSTGGGVTFGGGEPLLYVEFIQEFRKICGDEWHLCAETALNVPRAQVERAVKCIDLFYVDCKDTNPDIYQRYTGKMNVEMLDNLRYLIHTVGPERVVVRLPLIPEYNTEADRRRSRELLTGMGITQIDCFTYRR